MLVLHCVYDVLSMQPATEGFFKDSHGIGGHTISL